MIAYNKLWLNNLITKREASIAFTEGLISKEENQKIQLAYHSGFYQPNSFVRAGLFLLTCTVMLFFLGLMGLVFMNSIEKNYGLVLILFSILSYILLEIMVGKKHHYQSGVDDALIVAVAVSLFCGISLPFEFGSVANCILLTIISLFFSIRFTDSFMAVICFFSVNALILFVSIEIGGNAQVLLPFTIMLFSLMVYLFIRQKKDLIQLRFYVSGLLLLEIVSLLLLYGAGNYFVVREMSIELLQLNLQPSQPLPLGILFWIFTAVIPIVYLIIGIKKKDAILLRAGLSLIVAIVFTFRHYHAVLNIEIAMLVAGILLLLVSWMLNRFLKQPRAGFTLEEPSGNHSGKLQLESLIVMETFGAQPAQSDGTTFGAGDFGGAGASGNY